MTAPIRLNIVMMYCIPIDIKLKMPIDVVLYIDQWFSRVSCRTTGHLPPSSGSQNSRDRVENSFVAAELAQNESTIALVRSNNVGEATKDDRKWVFSYN